MTNREYELLDFIRTRNHVKWYKVLNAFGPKTEGRSNNAVLKKALSDGLIEVVWPGEKPPRCTIKLSEKGILALLAAEEQMQQESLIRAANVRHEKEQEQKRLNRIAIEKADRRAEKRADRKFQVALSLLNTLFSFLLGLLAEHFLGIIQWFSTFG